MTAPNGCDMYKAVKGGGGAWQWKHVGYTLKCNKDKVKATTKPATPAAPKPPTTTGGTYNPWSDPVVNYGRWVGPKKNHLHEGRWAWVP